MAAARGGGLTRCSEVTMVQGQISEVTAAQGDCGLRQRRLRTRCNSSLAIGPAGSHATRSTPPSPLRRETTRALKSAIYATTRHSELTSQHFHVSLCAFSLAITVLAGMGPHSKPIISHLQAPPQVCAHGKLVLVLRTGTSRSTRGCRIRTSANERAARGHGERPAGCLFDGAPATGSAQSVRRWLTT